MKPTTVLRSQLILPLVGVSIGSIDCNLMSEPSGFFGEDLMDFRDSRSREHLIDYLWIGIEMFEKKPDVTAILGIDMHHFCEDEIGGRRSEKTQYFQSGKVDGCDG